MSKDTYRFDNRSPHEFARDINVRTKIERQIIRQWASLMGNLTYRDTGCDNTGAYLDIKDVNSDPDYEVDTIGLVEVKFSLPYLTRYFHLKVSQVNSCIKQEAQVLMVNGWNETPQWVLLSVTDLSNITKWCEKVSWRGFGGKLSYKIPVSLYEWSSLD